MEGKKTKLSLILFFNSFLLNNIALGYISHGSSIQNIIYCPERIECATTGRPDSCKIIDNQKQYWKTDLDSNVVKGIYKLRVSLTNYKSNTVMPAACYYRYADSFPFPVDDIMFQLKDNGDFEALLEKGSKWMVYNVAICESSLPDACPMVEKPSLIINQVIVDENGNNTADQIKLQLATNGILYKHDMNAHSFVITYDEVFKACGSVKSCTIYIEEAFDTQHNYGSFEIDLTNNMHISNITQPSLSFPYIIQKHPLFNTIQLQRKNKIK